MANNLARKIGIWYHDCEWIERLFNDIFAGLPADCISRCRMAGSEIYIYLKDGTTITAKVSKLLYQKNPFDPGSILKFYTEERYKSEKGENGEWIKTNEKELWVTSYIVKLTDL